MSENDEIEPESSIDLIYRIDGRPNDVDVFELSRILESFGQVLKEAYRITHPHDGELAVTVRPFESGSFVMDIVLWVQHDPTLLFLLSNPEILKNVKETLSSIGFIKDVVEKGVSLIELVKKLGGDKPRKVERTGQDQYKFHACDGSVIPVNSTVQNLYSSPVINNYTVNIVAPAGRESVSGIRTYLKNDPESQVRISKEDALAMRAYAEPTLADPTTEVLEDTVIRLLNPKSGNYGQTTGTWSFTIAGSKRTIKAKIIDQDFLSKYSDGSIRFHQTDSLKVRLRERQILQGSHTKMEHEILEVLEYHQAQPPVRQLRP